MDILILMIPGMFGSAEDCAAEFAQLKDHSIAAISLRGRGKSSADFESYSFESHVSDVEATINHFKNKKIILFAHSYGCLVSIAAAAKFPEQVIGLVLVDKGLIQKPLSQAWFARVLETPPPHATLEVARRVYEDLKPVDLTDTFSSLHIPKLVFKGAFKSSALTREEAETLSQFKKTKVVTLKKSGHWPSPEDYPVLISEIKDFVGALSCK
jgi:pimeloyl-ACP methyl ester carboxylesterase